MKKIFTLMLFYLCLSVSTSHAGAQQDHRKIIDTVQKFVAEQTRALPGKTTFRITEPDKRLTLPICTQLEAFLSPGTQLAGNTNVGVRCNDKRGWSIFLPVTLQTSSTVLTLRRTLHTGQTVMPEDIATLTTDSLQPGTLSDPAQATGKIMKYGVGTGQILRYDMLRAPYTVKQGQTVQLKVRGAGFSVSNEGQALANASDGETVSARTASGQIISGIARQGAIEIIQ